MKQTLTKRLTMGAAAAAFFVVVYAVLAINDSMAQEVISLLSVLPLSLYTFIYGLGAGVLSMTAAVGLSAILVQPMVFVTYSIPTAIIGTLLGFLLRRCKTVSTVGTLSVLNLFHFVYELFMTKLFLKIDVWAEYKNVVNKAVRLFTNGDMTNTFTRLISDMTLFSIPIVFILGAVAKAGIYYIVLAVIIKRILKKEILLTVPHIRSNDLLVAWGYVGMLALFIVLLILTLTEIIGYSMVMAFVFDLIIALMYAVLMYWIRLFGLLYNTRSVKGMCITLLLILIFPITNLVFSLRALLVRR